MSSVDSRLGFILSAIRGGKMGGNEYRVLNKPRCRVIQTGAQGLATGTQAPILWDSPQLDSLGAYDTDSFYFDTLSRTRLTVKTPGVFGVTGFAAITGSAAGSTRQAYIFKNGDITTTWGRANYTVIAAIASYTLLNIATTLKMLAGDYIELYAVQDSGVPLNTIAVSNAPCCEMSMTLLSTL